MLRGFDKVAQGLGRVSELLDYSHNTMLVAASLAIALMAGFSGLSLTRGASALGNQRRKARVVMSAIVLGGGIWSMHFVAMLGLQLPILFYYDGLMTLISALIAILMVGLALLILHFRSRNAATLTIAGAIVGLGIAVMHYVGMAGMQLCRPVFSVPGVVAALFAALGLSILAIWVAYGARTKGNILLGTVCFGLSVFAVHFIAMAGTGFEPLGSSLAGGPSVSNEVMAIGVTIAAFIISGTFLLNGVSFIDPVDGIDPAQSGLADEDEPAPVPNGNTLLPVPYEKEGRTQFIERDAIAAVRAEGHYTVLYSGDEKLFCPWSISEAETRLGPSHFVRAHRSYLINPAYVTEFRRTRDSGVCFFDEVDSLPKVPVSRSRLGEVRAVLGV